MIGLSRNLTLKIAFLLDECLPPILRDSRWFMMIPFWFLFGKKARFFIDFKQRAHRLSPKAYATVYREVASVLIRRETDLNRECVEAILKDSIGCTVLDVGCGRGYLARRLDEAGWQVTGCDIHLDPEMAKRSPAIQWAEGNLDALPFEDASFDTVVCAHTLEHVQNFSLAVSELRRVAKKRLILVVPKQRPFRMTFDLHLHFFPYPESFLNALGRGTTGECRVEGKDLYYLENLFQQPEGDLSAEAPLVSPGRFYHFPRTSPDRETGG